MKGAIQFTICEACTCQLLICELDYFAHIADAICQSEKKSINFFAKRFGIPCLNFGYAYTAVVLGNRRIAAGQKWE